LRVARRLPVERTPVWFMRQAGRYLPEYRHVREKADFLTLCKTPDLAAEVTIQPVDIIGVDAAIIFSDILVVPEAMGMKLIVEEGKGGPRFPEPVRSAAEIDALVIPDPGDRLSYVMDALALTKRRLDGRVPLIGFSGAPWTLAAYMVDGTGTKDFRHAKTLLFSEPVLAHRLLEKLTRSVTEYLKAQVRAGADIVQIFDTWGGILGRQAFEEFSLRYIRQIVEEVRMLGVPVIVFCKGCGHSLAKLASTGADVIGLDWTDDVGAARAVVGEGVALQGNMDPVMLFAPPERIVSEVRGILASYGRGDGHIFNLGHGILPQTPVEHVKEFVQAVKSLSPQFHDRGEGAA
jgi:uroporphyrinogen decarboxylase